MSEDRVIAESGDRQLTVAHSHVYAWTEVLRAKAQRRPAVCRLCGESRAAGGPVTPGIPFQPAEGELFVAADSRDLVYVDGQWVPLVPGHRLRVGDVYDLSCSCGFAHSDWDVVAGHYADAVRDTARVYVMSADDARSGRGWAQADIRPWLPYTYVSGDVSVRVDWPGPAVPARHTHDILVELRGQVERITVPATDPCIWCASSVEDRVRITFVTAETAPAPDLRFVGAVVPAICSHGLDHPACGKCSPRTPPATVADDTVGMRRGVR